MSNRYSRLSAVPGIGEEGIEALRKGKVLVIGCGALGSMAAMYLAASGIGTIGIADFDTVDISNLQRQLFFDELALGQSKATVLAAKMKSLNSEISVKVFNMLLRTEAALAMFPDFDFIIDGSDNPSTKKMTAIVAGKLGVPYCIAGVRHFSGQIMTWTPGHQGYLDIFGEIEACSTFAPCSVAGVVGPAAGVAASVQATEAIKYLTGSENLLTDKLMIFDLQAPSSGVFSF